MKPILFWFAVVAAMLAIAAGILLPAAVEYGLLPASFAFLIGIGAACVLAYGLSIASDPNSED